MLLMLHKSFEPTFKSNLHFICIFDIFMQLTSLVAVYVQYNSIASLHSSKSKTHTHCKLVSKSLQFYFMTKNNVERYSVVLNKCVDQINVQLGFFSKKFISVQVLNKRVGRKFSLPSIDIYVQNGYKVLKIKLILEKRYREQQHNLVHQHKKLKYSFKRNEKFVQVENFMKLNKRVGT